MPDRDSADVPAASAPAPQAGQSLREQHRALYRTQHRLHLSADVLAGAAATGAAQPDHEQAGVGFGLRQRITQAAMALPGDDLDTTVVGAGCRGLQQLPPACLRELCAACVEFDQLLQQRVLRAEADAAAGIERQRPGCRRSRDGPVRPALRGHRASASA